MFRKAAASLVVLVIAFGAVFAEEVKGTFVKFADGVLTIKVGDKEKEYKDSGRPEDQAQDQEW